MRGSQHMAGGNADWSNGAGQAAFDARSGRFLEGPIERNGDFGALHGSARSFLFLGRGVGAWYALLLSGEQRYSSVGGVLWCQRS